ncbi:MAG: hypothetical protein AAFQ63_12595 [Cyanobacteria bacterium J06621_11]
MNVLPKTVSSQVTTATHHTSNNRSQKNSRKEFPRSVIASSAICFLAAASGILLTQQNAFAQSIPGNISHDAISGAVHIDNNAFNIQTGAFENESHIPLPAGLPAERQERVALPVIENVLAPNTIEITPDIDYINHALNEAIAPESENTQYQLDADSLQLTTQFNLRQVPRAHDYGEGIEVIISNEQDEVISRESAFVQGRKVKTGPNGQTLPTAAQIDAAYGANDTATLRVLNLRSNGADPSESGVYFSQDGELIVEDLQNGGDLDFNDGEYVQISGGQGEAEASAQTETVSVDTEVIETPLGPEMRTEELIVEEIVEDIVSADAISIEERDWGQVELDNPQSRNSNIGHATGVMSENGEHLVYNRYAGNSQIRAGSDGISATGQLKPLVDNPNVPPTLLSGSLTFNPFVGDNTAGLTGSVSVNQFLNPTHRLATDALGNAINNPTGDAPLVEPTGFLNNRRLIGYVPPTPDETVLGNQLFSTNGIFELPANQTIIISPATEPVVGPGNAAYTDNVGGLLIENAAGNMSFLPQWTKAGHSQDDISLSAGEAVRAIYALVPQQAGQNLTLGQAYDVRTGANGYEIANGGFSIISADQQPQNFAAETATVYAVEDTVAGSNAVTELFNGIQGLYAEEEGGDRISTIDLTSTDEADARVGNNLFPRETIPGDPGQQAYARTTRAAGLYLGGALTSGIGNQRDTVRQIDIEMDSVVSELLTQRTTNTFITPITQQDTITRQRTETTEESGTAFFDINSSGELTNVSFVESDSQVVSVDSIVLDRNRSIIRGEEELVSSTVEENLEMMDVEAVESDRTTEDRSDSYANLAALEGELTFGSVLNFGNTPWTSAANTIRAELFAQETVIGLNDDGIDTGWRAEVLFNPFGEVKREAHQYDENGNIVPVYRTEAALDADGQQIVEALTGANGELVNVLVNQFVLDEAGDRIAQTVGTGEAKGPAVYLRVQDTFSNDDGITVAGGFQLSF